MRGFESLGQEEVFAEVLDEELGHGLEPRRDGMAEVVAERKGKGGERGQLRGPRMK